MLFLLQPELSPLQKALQNIWWIAAAIGACIAMLTIGFTVFQYYQNTKINRAKFWLDLRAMFAKHEEAHIALKPGGEWGAVRSPLDKQGKYQEYRLEPTEKGPSTPREWAPIEAYMGLFELCERMLKKNLLGEDTFRALYRYRLTNLMWNKKIVNEKLIARTDGWKDSRDLLDRYKIETCVREPVVETIGPIESEEGRRDR